MGAGVTLGGNCLTTDLNSSSRLYFLMIVGGVVTGVQSSCLLLKLFTGGFGVVVEVVVELVVVLLSL